MGIFDRLFSGKRKDPAPEPDFSAMTDMEQFVYRFTSRGGHFLLAENTSQVITYLQAILTEEQLSRFVVFHPGIREWAGQSGLALSDDDAETAGTALLSDTLYLIRDTGGIMISALQTGGKALDLLPRIFVFLARPEQLRPDMHEAMAAVNKDFQGHYPSQIRTLSHFASSPSETSSKKTYLILNYGE